MTFLREKNLPIIWRFAATMSACSAVMPNSSQGFSSDNVALAFLLTGFRLSFPLEGEVNGGGFRPRMCWMVCARSSFSSLRRQTMFVILFHGEA